MPIDYVNREAAAARQARAFKRCAGAFCIAAFLITMLVLVTAV